VRRFAILTVLTLLLLLQVSSVAQQTTEDVQVNLVLIETLVMDGQERTVPGLTKEDFRMTVRGRPVEIDTFDVLCPAGAVDDPKAVPIKEYRQPIAPELGRKMVLLFDYYHLDRIARVNALRQAAIMSVKDKGPNDEIMVAAMADGLRIEQGFTKDYEEVVRTLGRMEYDVTLYGRDFQPTTDRPFFDNLGTLHDVLAQYEGAKAVVMFSLMTQNEQSQRDLWYIESAQRAAAARVAMYPVWAADMQAGEPTGGSLALARLATETGGRFTRMTNDYSMAFARAQRDLACRYTLGYYTNPEDARKSQSVAVYVEKKGMSTRSPDVIRLWSEQEMADSRKRAAFADPAPHQDPLVRSFVFPFRPAGKSKWETALALHFPVRLGPDGGRRQVDVTLAKATSGTVLNRYSREVTIDAADANGKDRQFVTLYGSGSIKPGQYVMTSVLSGSESQQLQTTRIEFSIPEVPADLLVLRGPLLAKVDPDGLRLKADDKPGRFESELDQLAGAHSSFEPLIVQEIEPAEHLLSVWDLCFTGKQSTVTNGTIERRVLEEEGDGVVHQFEPVELKLEPEGKVLCQAHFDSLPGGTLAAGKYRVEISVTDRETEQLVARSVVPLAVREAD
jgi:VWFA-related protein